MEVLTLDDIALYIGRLQLALMDAQKKIEILTQGKETKVSAPNDK